MTPATLARLACDAVLERIILAKGGRVLAMDSLGRLFSPAQRRALAARDGGCTFPGCDRPASWCDSHHVIFWTDGGPTTVDNGALLCGPHQHPRPAVDHRDASRHSLVSPPPAIDPRQRPIRNTVHDAITDNQRIGQQLHLNLPIDPPPDDG